MSTEDFANKYSFRAKKKLQNEQNDGNRKKNLKAILQSTQIKNPSLQSFASEHGKSEAEPVKTENDKSRGKSNPNELKISQLSRKRNQKDPIKVEFEESCVQIPGTKLVKDESDDRKKEKFEPPQWREVLDKIRDMRSGVHAPVDDMGCDQCMDESAAPEVSK